MGVYDLMEQEGDEFGGQEGLLPREEGEIPLSNLQEEDGFEENVGWKIG